MSAWIVSRAHIDVLVQGLCESEHVTHLGPDEVGRSLWQECLRSVAYRYPADGDGNRPGPVDFRDDDVETYTYRRPSVRISLTGLHHAIACYAYQSCEHQGWQNSDAERWTSGLRAVLAKHPEVCTDPPSGEHPWGYEETDVHQASVPVG
ncbi:hypothetical protein [Klenkia sp. PcliD-1-E]|uniref:hypothetical protein n=1 Tax=Klenkia sp. PcliD-1-E TaxID=2954492 RepID=UPI0020981C3E|nr:hypothetical protein [Klenkia sp. PcliD-1-E]MCO7219488.1 hypothetical protein [Klenkia sp. PcliD-1-E]